jgi:hypothetical protein
LNISMDLSLSPLSLVACDLRPIEGLARSDELRLAGRNVVAPAFARTVDGPAVVRTLAGPTVVRKDNRWIIRPAAGPTVCRTAAANPARAGQVDLYVDVVRGGLGSGTHRVEAGGLSSDDSGGVTRFDIDKGGEMARVEGRSGEGWTLVSRRQRRTSPPATIESGGVARPLANTATAAARPLANTATADARPLANSATAAARPLANTATAAARPLANSATAAARPLANT